MDINQATAPVRRAASDPRVHRESQLAALHAALALHRIDRIGVADAMVDARVLRRLRRAQRHASRAVALAVAPPPRHRLRNVMLLIGGVGVGAATVVVLRRTSQPELPPAEVDTYEPQAKESDNGADGG
jgi:hypothetical protein